MDWKNLIDAVDWTAVRLSLALAVSTTVLLAGLGLPLAWWAARTRGRVRAMVEAAVLLPLVLPPTVAGFYILQALGPRSWPGRTYEALTGERLVFSFTAVLAASVLVNAALAVRPFISAFAAVDPRLVDVSRCLGASGWRTFRKVVLPLAWPGILTGLVLVFLHCLGEFGVVLMVGGNIPGETRTLSISIYDSVQTLDFARANATALLLVVVVLAGLSVLFALQRRLRPDAP